MPKSTRRGAQEINASSMADIAFLLLIFFLVTTTMDIDKGIISTLPPISEEPPDDTQANKRNVLNILANKRDEILAKGEPVSIKDLKELVIKHVTNNGKDPNYSDSPQDAIISLKNDRGTSYDVYVRVLNEVRAGYNEMRDKEAMNKFGMKYKDLSKEDQKKVSSVYPIKLSEAEPEDFGAQE